MSSVIMLKEQMDESLKDLVSDLTFQLVKGTDWENPTKQARLAGKIQGLEEARLRLADVATKFVQSEDQEISML